MVRGDAQRLPFADAAFRSALMVDVFEWLRHPAATLAEIGRVTDGPIMIVQTDWEGLWFQADEAEIGRDLVRAFTKGAPGAPARNDWRGGARGGSVRRASVDRVDHQQPA